MNPFLKISYLVLFVFFQACISSQKANKKDQKQINTSQNISLKMKEKGFSKGFLTLNTSSNTCPYILNVEKYKDNLDPINLQNFFKNKIPEKVWVQYSDLRMNNRCSSGRPVSVIEISERID